MKRHENFEKEAELQISQITEKIGKLENAAKNSSSEIQKDIQKTIRELRGRIKTMQIRLQELKNYGENAYSHLKEKITKNADTTKEVLYSAYNELSDSNGQQMTIEYPDSHRERNH